MSATASQPISVSFEVVFDAPGIAEDYWYLLRFQQQAAHVHPAFSEESLSLGGRPLFHQQQGQWLRPPPLAAPPGPGAIMLGALTGVQEVTIAHLVLTSGIGCYAFPDDVFRQRNRIAQPSRSGLSDSCD